MHARIGTSTQLWAIVLILTLAFCTNASASLMIDIQECQFSLPEGYALSLGQDSTVSHFYFYNAPENGTVSIHKGTGDLTSLKQELVGKLNYTVEEGKTAIGDYMIFRSSQGISLLDAGVAQMLGWTLRFQGETVGLIESFYSDCERSRGKRG